MNTDDDPNNSSTLKMIRVLVVAVIVGLAGLALLIALSGCTSSAGGDPQAAATTTAPVSSSAAPTVSSSAPAGAAQGVLGQTAYTSSGVKVVANTPTVTAKGPQWASQSGDACVSFQVAVINNSAATLPGPGAWELRGADGRKYSLIDRCGSDPVQQFPDGALQPQAVAAGAVVFIGPEHGVLRYTPYNDAAGTISWTY